MAHRMLSVKEENGKTLVQINSSSLDLLQTCLRKSHYVLNRNLKNEDSTALAFGSAIHKALEHWYTLPFEERALNPKYNELAEVMAYGHGVENEARGPLESIRQFVLARFDTLKTLDESDKRSLSNGVRILQDYFRHYKDDGFEVYRDSQGPVIEREVTATIYDSPSLRIDYFGTIDVILHNPQTGVITVTDHKTTSALGTEFYNRCKPNFQYTGYVWLAKQSLKIDTNLFMINGIQVAKTKTSFARQVTERTDEDFAELRSAVIHNVKKWLAALTEHVQEVSAFPMTAPNPCSMYGGCSFLRICEVSSKLKESVIKALYPS